MSRPFPAALLVGALAAAAALSPLQAREAPQPGPVATLALALRLYDHGAREGDALGMAVAVRLAGSIRQREAHGWTKESGKAPTGQAAAIAARSAVTLDLLTSDAAMSGALLMAEEDPALSDLLYEAPPVPLRGGVSLAQGNVQAGQRDSWTIPYAGFSPAEIAVFAGAAQNGGGADLPALTWSLEDGSGAVLCPARAVAASVCSFTPGENGFYRVVIDNQGASSAPYMLVSN